MVSVVFVESFLMLLVLAPVALPLALALWLARKYSAVKDKGGKPL